MRKSIKTAFAACIIVIGLVACLPTVDTPGSSSGEAYIAQGDPIFPPVLPPPPPPLERVGVSARGEVPNS
ncbi:MAG TPA: hypothetical protein VLG72_07350 [Nitrospirota bacterium]|nr:hypothetical protein [Nitrospirota bacterium]